MSFVKVTSFVVIASSYFFLESKISELLQPPVLQKLDEDIWWGSEDIGDISIKKFNVSFPPKVRNICHSQII